ncbi:hypothetical protein HanIR_Chr01g0027891 [Helianthus annuus]|nr:hypothetical protein HanIR_Chr01g0027891 [Helianthus annuus]
MKFLIKFILGCRENIKRSRICSYQKPNKRKLYVKNRSVVLKACNLFFIAKGLKLKLEKTIKKIKIKVGVHLN